jgi:uncharacterized protein
VPDADERPAALPAWRWSQHWGDVLFFHWDVPAAALRPHVPAPLEVATLDGTAWVSLVLFRMRVRARGLPFLPGLSDLAEINLRTYVHHRGRTGIWFLSIRADNRWAAGLARLLTPLPYTHAAVEYARRGDGFRFTDPSGAAITFRPTGRAPDPAGRRDDWLVERYRVFAAGRGGLVQAQVSHARWPTEGVEVSAATGPFGAPLGLDLSPPPRRSLFSSGVWVRFGPFRRVEGDGSSPPGASATGYANPSLTVGARTTGP